MTPTKLIQRMPRTLPGCIFAILLAVLVAGCGGGPGNGELAQVQSTTVSRVFDLVARTGPIVAVQVGQTAVLSDLNSYTSSTQPLSFHWSFSSKPDASNAVLQNATTTNPSFVADAKGTYTVQLVVSAEGLYSHRAVQLVVAMVSPEDPTGAVSQSAAQASAGLQLKISLNPTLQNELSPDSTVFVFVRAVENPGPPLAVVRTKVAELPFQIALNDSNAMIPSRPISGARNVIVGARISASGNPERQPGDYEQLSDSIPANTDQTVELIITDKL